MSTLILWSKTFHTTSGQYPTLYNYLAITQEELICWVYHLDNPNTSVNPKFLIYTTISTFVLGGGVASHV